MASDLDPASLVSGSRREISDRGQRVGKRIFVHFPALLARRVARNLWASTWLEFE